MRLRRLGRDGPYVSEITLGTMTWGEQNSEAEAFAQMDLALDRGINLFDTAELYAIPPRAQTYGATERIIGNWLRSRKCRARVLIASKVCGPTDWCPHIRGGKARLNKAQITAACEASLRRLGTDYIDLYQVHWPERKTNYFGRRGYVAADDGDATPIEETLEALACLVEAGKVRYLGVSNETPWGLMRYLRHAEQAGLPRIVSIQNPYNLLNRSFEVGLAEIAERERVPLLAYSPLAFGVLSGKYLKGAKPAGARLTLFPHYTRYSSPLANEAVAAYVALAREFGCDPAQMALAFVLRQSFVGSVIIGATNLDQLRRNIASADLDLSDELLARLEEVQARYPDPCP
ncbi:MAG: NADP(H)-dependent aldo-keto reductase [Zetaproteobacteria bacterium]|nr:MAG: NADP(H)-dependent aldo-keto reductase [Zetaproteobacteria bacterium]